MLNVELSQREVTNLGLYIMRWKGKVGLVRIVGHANTGGLKIIAPEGTVESYMRDLPKDGAIPADAFFSEPLAVVNV